MPLWVLEIGAVIYLRLTATAECWDLLQLEMGCPSNGGEQLCQRIHSLLHGDPSPTRPWRVAFEGETLIQVLGQDLVVQADHMSCPWAITADLFSRYWIPSAAS